MDWLRSLLRWNQPSQQAPQQNYSVPEFSSISERGLQAVQPQQQQPIRDTGAVYSGGGNVLGASTGGGYRPPTPTYNPPTPSGPSPQDMLAQQMGLIRARLESARGGVNDLRNNAMKVRDDLTSNAESTYSNLEKTIRDKVASSLERLGQEDIGVQNLYGRAGGNARRAASGAELKNRMAARAMGRLNSSFYDDRQAGVREGLSRSLGSLGEEEAGKRAGIKTRSTETSNWGDQQVTGAQTEKTSLLNRIMSDWANTNTNLDQLQRGYDFGSYEDAMNAERDYGSRIDQINNFIQNRALTMAQIAAQAGDRNALAQAYQAIDPTLQQALSNTTGLNQASSQIAGLPTFSGSQPTVDMLGFSRQPDTYEEIMKRLGNILV